MGKVEALSKLQRFRDLFVERVEVGTWRYL